MTTKKDLRTGFILSIARSSAVTAFLILSLVMLFTGAQLLTPLCALALIVPILSLTEIIYKSWHKNNQLKGKQDSQENQADNENNKKISSETLKKISLVNNIALGGWFVLALAFYGLSFAAPIPLSIIFVIIESGLYLGIAHQVINTILGCIEFFQAPDSPDNNSAHRPNYLATRNQDLNHDSVANLGFRLGSSGSSQDQSAVPLIPDDFENYRGSDSYQSF